MKQYAILFTFLTCYNASLLQAQANQSLSNLSSPTAVNQTLTPNSNGTLDFGTGFLNWRNLYLSGSIYRNTTRIFNVGGNNLAIGANSLNTNSGISNVAIGNNALFSATNAAINNIGIGYSALYTNNTGGYNIGLGSSALYSNTSGFGNVAIGNSAMQQNTTGQRNVAIGFESMRNNTTASFNTALGYIALRDNTTGRGNTAIGYAALLLNTTGRHNSAIGDSALYNNNGFRNTAAGAFSLWKNTTGNDNAAAGTNSLAANTSGFSNVAMGSSALSLNVSGSLNTAIGFESLKSNTTAYHNTAIGVYSMKSNTTGYFNVAIGSNAAASNTTGFDNIAIGSNALIQNVTGNGNIAIGKAALQENQFGQNQVAIGDSALHYNKPYTDEKGFQNGSRNTAVGSKAAMGITEGRDNTAIGYNSLLKNSRGVNNTAIGSLNMEDLISGDANTSVGTVALSLLKEGTHITAIGENSGQYLTKGNTVTFLGAYSGIPLYLSECENATAVGGGSLITASHQVRVGNEFTTSIGGEVDWTTLSDGRFKKDVKQNVPGLSFINKLKAVTYELDVHGISDYLHKGEVINDKAVEHNRDRMQFNAEKNNLTYSGFIAQEVEEAAKSLHYEFSGVDAPKNEHDYYGLRYGQFVVPLVKAVQELSKANDSKDATIEQLQNEIHEIREQMDQIIKSQTSEQTGVITQSITLNSTDAAASLQQNIPNPYTNTTLINFTLPKQYNTAVIVIADMNGKTLQKTNVAGFNSLRVASGNLAAGSYTYSLFIDGKITSTKTMVIAK